MDDYVRVLSRRNANESLESGGITPPKKSLLIQPQQRLPSYDHFLNLHFIRKDRSKSALAIHTASPILLSVIELASAMRQSTLLVPEKYLPTIAPKLLQNLIQLRPLPPYCTIIAFTCCDIKMGHTKHFLSVLMKILSQMYLFSAAQQINSAYTPLSRYTIRLSKDLQEKHMTPSH